MITTWAGVRCILALAFTLLPNGVNEFEIGENIICEASMVHFDGLRTILDKYPGLVH